ncbi:MAG: SynChlorMet cassette radical SAM/SPASM protein ScmE [Candidatus Omnitrophota bacterium]|nr:SynChlorMet cassette radical SAM/SPASM protein ScmE [Candidatus Omnitrophota bacterium]
MDLAITGRCNLRCTYCAHFTSPAEVAADLPTEEWLRFFDELGAHGVTAVTLSGGEPFIRDDLMALLQGIVRNRMRFAILSNGTLITGQMAAYIASTGRCNYVQVSIDGAAPETHDVTRGEGTFGRAVAGLKILMSCGIHAAARVTISKHNVRELERIAQMLLDDLGLGGFGTNAASYQGLCRKNTDIQLSTQDRVLAMRELLRLNRIYNNRIQAAAGPLAEAHQWAKMMRARDGHQPGLSQGGFLRSCHGMFKQIAVRADGVMVPCGQLSHMELGRINKDSLVHVWRNHPTLNAFRERVNIPLSNFTQCRPCEYVNYCSGNCPALAYTLAGSDAQPSPDACLKRFLEDGGVLPEEALVNG